MDDEADDMHGDQTWRDEQLSAWLDGALDDGTRATVARHLATCAACRAALDELHAVRDLLRALPAPALPRSFALPLTDAPVALPHDAAPQPSPLQSATQPPPRPPRWARTAQRLGGLAVAAGMLLVLGTALLSGHGAAPTASSLARPPQSIGTVQGTPATSNHLPGASLATRSASSALPAATTSAAPTAGQLDTGNAPGSVPAIGGSQPPILPLAGAGLAGGGVALLAAGTLARRRSRPGA